MSTQAPDSYEIETWSEPEPAPELSPAPRPARFRAARAVIGLLGVVLRFVIGAMLCARYVSSVVVVGWVFRLMRRRILHGWWLRSPERDRVPFAEFAAAQGHGIAPGTVPHWLVSDQFGARVNRPRPGGEPVSLWRRLSRLPGASLGALGWNVRTGLAALACTYILTLPGCFLWLAAWYDGWNTSFTKGYEQSQVGFLTGALGSALFIAAMLYVPMAWAHFAATADARAFFQFGFITRLIRHRLAEMTFFAAAFSLATLPVSILRVAPGFFTNNNPQLELGEISPQQVQQILDGYYLAAGAVVFVLYVVVHLLVARLYRSGVLSLLRRDPAVASELHPRLYQALDQLGLLPAGPAPRRHPLVAVIVGTGRLGTTVLLWVVGPLLWFTLVAQVFVAAFLNLLPVQSWMNQALVHLPCLYFSPGG